MSGYYVSAEDVVGIEQELRKAIIDAYRYGIGAAITTLELHRSHTFDTDAFDQAINDLRRQSAEAEKP